MPLKKSTGNMYPWVTHMHTHPGGECSHKCIYCYVDHFSFGRPDKYKGAIRLLENEFRVKYGSGRSIFIEHCNDLFAEDVPGTFIGRICKHCNEWPENTYIFQTKNPRRYLSGVAAFPPMVILGTTIETNRRTPGISAAPSTESRMNAMLNLGISVPKFVTIEPVLDFDVDILAAWIDRIRPAFLNLGADSKKHELSEPSYDKIQKFIQKLKDYGIELREKRNLDRLKF